MSGAGRGCRLRRWRGKLRVRDNRSRRRERCVAQADRDIEERVADLLVGDMQVLVREEAEELVLDDRAAEGAARPYSGAAEDSSCWPGCSASCLKKNGAALIQLVPRWT